MLHSFAETAIQQSSVSQFTGGKEHPFLQWLMTEEKSPIIDFYPLSFELDAEGKRQDWEAVVVLQFINVPRLRAAEGRVPLAQLSPEELRRNQFGPMLHFVYDAGESQEAKRQCLPR